MRILVLHRKQPETRKTIDDHLYSFRRYVKNACFFYCDVKDTVPFFLTWLKWDGIIVHYTLLAEKFALNHKHSPYRHLPKRLRVMEGYKVALPQDEYFHTEAVIRFFKSSGIQTVFTCLPQSEHEKVYPLQKTGLKHRITTLTGFVDEASLTQYQGATHDKRPIDLGYRARHLPYWFGRHAQLKHEIAQLKFKSLRCDISTRPEDTFYGDAWIDFIRSCRAMLGCEGGVSLLHRDDRIKAATESYLKTHPEASFDEVEQNCFPNTDGNLRLFTLGPRHFECAMAKTCQVLVEGEYQGVFQPGIHYIELKRDFSNLGDVESQLQDVRHCEAIAERAYRDIVASGHYSYRKFACDVVEHIKENGAPPQRGQQLLSLLVRVLLMMHTSFRLLLNKMRKIKRKWVSE